MSNIIMDGSSSAIAIAILQVVIVSAGDSPVAVEQRGGESHA